MLYEYSVGPRVRILWALYGRTSSENNFRFCPGYNTDNHDCGDVALSLTIVRHVSLLLFLLMYNFGNECKKLLRRLFLRMCFISSSLHFQIIFNFRELCDGKMNCTLSASSELFGNPCTETTKYLRLLYYCSE